MLVFSNASDPIPAPIRSDSIRSSPPAIPPNVTRSVEECSPHRIRCGLARCETRDAAGKRSPREERAL